MSKGTSLTQIGSAIGSAAGFGIGLFRTVKHWQQIQEGKQLYDALCFATAVPIGGSTVLCATAGACVGLALDILTCCIVARKTSDGKEGYSMLN